jgi:hypothetical protein
MAAGMWQGLLAGYQSVEEKRAAREEKEEEVLRRRRSAAAALRPQIQSQLEQVQSFRSGLSYLRDRGLSEGTLNALAQDPAAFEGAMEFARTSGADMEPGRLNEIFRASVVDNQTPQDAFEYFNTLEQTLSGFDAVEDPEVFVENLPPLTPTRNAIIETRIPERGQETTITEQDSIWKNQADLFDRRVYQVGNDTLQTLRDKEQSETGLSEDEEDLIPILDSDLNNNSPAAKARLRRLFAESVSLTFASDPEDYRLRITENPYLQGVFEYIPPHTPPAEGVLEAQGRDTGDGIFKFLYRMPDGTLLTVLPDEEQ